MSAFVVGENTINEIVTFLYNGPEWSHVRDEILTTAGLDRVDGHTMPLLAESLHAMNVVAVNQRYGEHNNPLFPGFTWRPSSPIQVCKSLACLRYQCTEGDVPDSPLYKAITSFRDRLTSHIVTGLPEYSEAHWGD